MTHDFDAPRLGVEEPASGRVGWARGAS